MKERPILFSGPMVRAILDGRKTQTRRVVKPQPQNTAGVPGSLPGDAAWPIGHGAFAISNRGAPPEFVAGCPYGVPGDRLYVRETLRAGSDGVIRYEDGTPLNGVPTGFSFLRRYCPGMFMPYWASRLTLEVVSVRVERLNEISEEDAIAEGSQCAGVPASLTNRGAFAKLWDSINGNKHPWASNPWVFVVEFKRLEAK